MIINDRKIGPGEPPYIIAEISGNHGGSFDKACFLMGLAAGAGADAVKLQAYTPDTITLDSDKDDFIVKDGPWKGVNLHELYKKTHTPWEWFPALFEMGKNYGQTVFASVFDKTSVDMLEELDCPAYKIASMEITDIPLIEYVASKGKPMILSMGMASWSEVQNALDEVDLDCVPRATLHCVSGYPSNVEDYNLHAMRKYTKIHGVSDHTLGWEIPVAATALGAHIIEKHLCVSRQDKVEDAAFSLEPEEFKQMCKAVRNIWRGLQQKERPEIEQSSRQLRRSLYVTADMKKGDVFTEANVRSIRPGYGLPPIMLPEVLGQCATRDIERGSALKESMVMGLMTTSTKSG